MSLPYILMSLCYNAMLYYDGIMSLHHDNML